MRKAKAIIYAVMAAVLYALMTPVAKLLQIGIAPVAEAGLLYIGAGAGMLIIYLVQSLMGIRQDRPSVGIADLRYVIAMVILDMLAPVFLLLGLSTSAPESVSLLNNFEIVATTVIAVTLFHERAGRKLIAAICIITTSCILLSLERADSLRFTAGSLFVILACICWGFENNCTSSLSEKDTRQIVMIKGLGSGTASLLISFVIHEGAADMTAALAVVVLGFLSVGLSVFFYVLAQGEIGAARTSAYYAVSPFAGVLLSLLFFRQMPGKLFWAALIVMGIGVYFNIQDTKETANQTM